MKIVTELKKQEASSDLNNDYRMMRKKISDKEQ